MSSDRPCLRCHTDMQLGRVSHRDQVYPQIWTEGAAEQPSGKIRILSTDEAAVRRQAAASAVASQRLLDAYRCPACGYVELAATRAP